MKNILSHYASLSKAAVSTALAISLVTASIQTLAQSSTEESESIRVGADFGVDDGSAALKITPDEARNVLSQPLPASPEAAYVLLQQQERAAKKLGNRARQIEALHKIVEIARGRPERQKWQVALANLEFNYGSQGRAAELVEQWLEDHTLSDPARAMLALRLAYFYYQTTDRVRGDRAWSRAQDPYQRALANPKTKGPERMTFYYLAARSEVERVRGDLQASVDTLRQAVVVTRRAMENQLRQAKGDIHNEEFVVSRVERDGALALLTYALVRLSRNIEAAAVAEEGLRLAEVEKYGIDHIGRWHYRLANVLLATRAYSKALEHARSAERLLSQAGATGASQTMWLARREQLLALLGLRRYAEADAIYANALADMPSDALARNRASDVRLQTILAAKNGRFDQALALIEGHLKARSRLYGDKHPLTLEARGVRGLTHLLAGNAKRAIWDYEELFSTTLDTPSGWLDLGLGGFRGYTLSIAFEEYLRHVADAYRQTGAVDANMIDRALQIVDRMNLTVTQEALIDSTARLLAINPKLQKALADEQTQRQRLRELYRELSTLLSKENREKQKEMSDAERKAWREEIKGRREAIETAQAKLAALREDIAQRFPAYADLATPGTPSPAILQKLLAPDEALVMIHPGDFGTLIWAVTPEGKTTFHLGASTAEQIAQQVTAARRVMDLSATAENQTPSLDASVLHALYRDLLKPFEPLLKKTKSLIVAAQGPLASLPFAALVVTEQEAGKAPEWLIQRMAITQVPTSSSLLALRRTAASVTAPRPLIGFGDPVFDPTRRNASAGSARRITTGKTSAAPAKGNTAKRPTKVKPALVTRESTSFDIERGFRYANMPDLPETRAELLALARALGADPQQDLYLGERASRNAVLETDLSDRRVVAFATHGLMPGEIPGVSKPSLALSVIASNSTDQSPLLTLDDVLALRLNAQWVVLSACNTAAGEMDGSAMSGLVRGFFFAGARSVLATHWSVESASAEALVSNTFKHTAEESRKARATSLREAQLAMIDGKIGDGKWRHPFYWAPYSLFGDPSR